jgi:hypothetical protein
MKKKLEFTELDQIFRLLISRKLKIKSLSDLEKVNRLIDSNIRIMWYAGYYMKTSPRYKESFKGYG